MFGAIKRRLFKSAVAMEFHKTHGFNLWVIAEPIGAGTLDDLLNLQYEEARGDPVLASKYVTQVLQQSFGIDVEAHATRVRMGVDPF